METYKGVELFYAQDRNKWPNWLKKNHASKASVWLVYYKPSSGKTRVSYDDAVDEAICFGWIDSKPNKLDEDRLVQFFAPRNPKSNWSAVNKMRVEKLIREKRMQPAGLAVIEEAKRNGSWSALDEFEQLFIPEDLQHMLDKNPVARAYFMAFPRSSKKNILEWIHNAKQPQTRQKRIEETVRLAKDNNRANHYRQPKGR